MKKQPAVTEQTKANLCEAFWKLYVRKPIEKITVTEITSLAGYNRGTFYLYYLDVYDLLAKIEAALIDDIRSRITEQIAKAENFDPLSYMSMIVQIHQAYSSYVSVLLDEHGDANFTSALKELIRPLWKKYLLPAGISSALETELILEYHLSGFLAMTARWLSAPGEMTVEAFVRFAVQNFLTSPAL